MTPEQKQAWDMQQNGMSRAQIAKALGISESGVKRRLERARAWNNADPAAKQAATVAGSEMIPHSFWVKSDTHSIYYKTPQDDASTPDLLATIADAFKDIPAYRPNPVAAVGNGLLTVYPVMDAHFGMFAWGKETGGQDYDLTLAECDLNDAFDDIWSVSPKSDIAVLLLGGDTLHADDNRAETPQSKHKLDTDGRHFKAVEVALRAVCRIIDGLAERHSQVIVRVLRGNHDPHSHMILTFALNERYRLADMVQVDMSPRDLFTIKHGRSLIAAHHGDRSPPQRLAMSIADECPHWSETRDRHILTGHIHHDSVKDFPGVKWWSLRAFCPADEYGSMFGPRRALQAMTFHYKKGLILQAIEPILRGEG